MHGAPGLAAAAVALALAGAAACGPSFQVVYDGNVRFEHCYALDASPSAPLAARKDCWRDWLHSYAYGQSRDRIEYAATRLSELSLDQSLPTVEASRPQVAAAGNAPHRARIVAAPVPTNAFAPPPSTMGDDKSAARPPDAANASALVPVAPGSDCANGCAMAWKTCRDVCADKTCDACDGGYKICVPACFHEPPAAPASSAAHPRSR
jgi:hypothetical protein